MLDDREPAGAGLDEELGGLGNRFGWQAVAESVKRLAKPDKRKQLLREDCWVLAPILRDEARRQLAGEAPSMSYLILAIPLTTIFCEISFRSFQKAKRAFADVL